MPGSFVGESGADNLYDLTPVVCADDDYRSQKSAGEEVEVNVQLVEEQGKSVEKPEAKKDGKNINLRRDPEEEFFMLAILALKMQHTESHEAEFIYQIDSQKLYE